MKPTHHLHFLAMAVLLMLEPQATFAGQPLDPATPNPPRYNLVDLGTLGGPQSYLSIPDNYAPVLNDQGTVVGSADTSTADPYPNFCFNEDCFASHAFQWKSGVLQDMGTLPGGANSAATWINASGLIAGLSENGEIDPLIPGFPELHAVLWKGGEILDLGTLEGGYESVANAANSRGQVVGAALNGILDPFSMIGLGYQTRAFLWQKGAMHDLGTLGGTDSVANLLNERGQIVGESYTSSVPSPYCSQIGLPLTAGAFLWQNGKMTDLGNFGGTCTFASDLNNRGQVVGLSTLAGDLEQHPFVWDGGMLTDLGTFGGSRGEAVANNEAGDVVGWAQTPDAVHAFYWKNGTMIDLGTVDGDPCSVGFGLNSKSQIIGISASCDFEEVRGFLSEKGGPMIDLDTLVPPGSSLHLETPLTINERGEIAGVGFLPNGDAHAFLLVPCGSNVSEVCQHASAGTTASTRVNATHAIRGSRQSNVVRQLLRQRMAGRDRITGLRGM